jgi:hypothetical protein
MIWSAIGIDHKWIFALVIHVGTAFTITTT